MAPILYTARYLLPISAPPIEDGALLVDGGRILNVGKRNYLARNSPAAKIVDFGDAVLMPPMVNTHTHLELSHVAEWARAAGTPVAFEDFVDWILWLVAVRKTVTGEQIKQSLDHGLRVSVQAGTGAVGDILTRLDAVGAYRGTALMGRVYAEVLGNDMAVVDERLRAIADSAREQAAPSLVWGLSPHAPYSLSSSALEQVYAFAVEQKLQCSIHLAESSEESRFIKTGSGAIAEKLYAAAQWDPAVDSPPGCSPVKALCRKNLLKQGDLVIHGVQVDDEDIALLHAKGCHVVLCPRSNATLNVGRAPVEKYLQAGVPLALGTDSMASVTSLSVWEELAFAQTWFAGAAKPGTWLAIATLGGARALGLQGRQGALVKEHSASFQVVTLPGLPAHGELEGALCHAGEDVKVKQLFLNGQNVLPER